MTGNMRSITLGNTGLEVTSLCVGTSALGSTPEAYGYEIDAARALATLRAILQGPITFIDTSNEYGNGESERRIGTAIRDIGGLPQEFVLATKVDPDASGDFSADRVLRSVEESQERLGMDYFPLVYLHDPERITFDEAMGPNGAVEALISLRARGTVGHIGVAGGTISVLQQYVATRQFEVLVTHNRYTLLDRSAVPLLDNCAEAGIAVVNGAPFGGGMLSKGPSLHPNYGYKPAPSAVRDRALALEAACSRREVPLAAAALQFSMRDPRVCSTIVGFTRPERIAQTIDLANFPIPDDLWVELEDLAAPEEFWLS
jgi:D-threo-aldose 1-dehydrogenase